VHHCIGRGGIVREIHRHIGAGAAERQRHRAADARAGAGNECGLTLQ
jgi:hypothetical protein